MSYHFWKGKIKALQGKEMRRKTCFIKLDNGKDWGARVAMPSFT